jgi:hypothetical protein
MAYRSISKVSRPPKKRKKNAKVRKKKSGKTKRRK